MFFFMINQSRVVIENISPLVEGGIFPVKRVLGEIVHVEADVFPDGHDVIQAELLYKPNSRDNWSEIRMKPTVNDRWEASFEVSEQGFYKYKISAWVDHPLNWQHGIERKIDDGQKVTSELLEGRIFIEKIIPEADETTRQYLTYLLEIFADENQYQTAITEAISKNLKSIFIKHPDRFLSNESPEYAVYVDRVKARFSTWYEFFPRSASEAPNVHGTFKDCHRLLPRIAQMGFDVLYFPPVHPIGEVNRKGKNNATVAKEGDVGSPWGIGSNEGGHKSLHSQLGDMDDFKQLIHAANEHGIEIAMDFALQCAPDHPYVKEHPKWFKWRPDGTVQYAENPPKKYQDILPIHFETEDFKNLWNELLDIALYWIDCGIRIFRVDNPHTKPYFFWGWLINEVKLKHPDVLFLAEAFTRPKIMHQLAKQGFTQSYTYFTWRNSKHELIEYLTELTQTTQREFFRPNFWPNTPDINPYDLQSGLESVHLQKYFLAATLSSNTGIYGPVFEQMVCQAVPGKEEYLDSEKYEIHHWDWYKNNKLTMLISKINHIRKEHASLQQTNNIQFCSIENNQLLAYYKFDDSRSDETLMIVNLDPYYKQQGWVQLPLQELGIREGHPVRVYDLITDSSYIWNKEWNYVEIHPSLPFHLFKIYK